MKSEGEQEFKEGGVLPQMCGPIRINQNLSHAQHGQIRQLIIHRAKISHSKNLKSKSGVYDLSETSNGLSRIRLFTDFFKSDQADWMFEQLLDELPWKQRSHRFQSEKYLEPRLTAWYGELPYTYSGTTLQPNPEWSPALQVIKQQLEERTGYTFNSMLANLYRDGHDSIDWHSDDEKSLGPAPVIASLSFGDSRNFELRKKPPTAENGDYTYMEHVRVPVTHGCLIIMEGATQADWQHRVPKEYHDRDPRINLTFRVIYSES
ncbi:alpha-ketoglutarate-dependent dioxygenase alkB homolog 3-like isoform X2 [Tubulanus polymorphus]|uniref:alpha-ketoglutarate-dependent dioxygenase alkB homolog 3-like isoform X2 n=1 Tax=Tubulanus polymorphus TaxID=672921 RepID=UPI003DA26AAF